MKRMITQTMKAAALAVSLFGASAVAQAAAITPGQSVTEFITSEEYGILSAPALTTADSLANWAYGSYNDGNVMGYQDQRGWRAVFEVTAPAAGKYGVEVKLRTTTTNWMVGFGASKSLELSERMKDSISVPIWENMVRPTLISTVSERVDTIAEADTINGIPAITETTYSFETGEWETIYVPVELTQIHYDLDGVSTLYGSYTVLIYGDVNGDGAVQINDLIKVRNHLVGSGTLTGLSLSAADANRDGNVMINDLIKLRNHIAGGSVIEQ